MVYGYQIWVYNRMIIMSLSIENQSKNRDSLNMKPEWMLWLFYSSQHIIYVSTVLFGYSPLEQVQGICGL